MNQIAIERAWKIAHSYDHDWAQYVWEERLDALRAIRTRNMNQTSQWWFRRHEPALAKALYDEDEDDVEKPRRLPKTLEEAQLLNLLPYSGKPDGQRFLGSTVCGHLTRVDGVHCVVRTCGILEVVVYRFIGFSRHVLKAEVQPNSAAADVEICGDYLAEDIKRLARPLCWVGIQQVNGAGHAAVSLQQRLDKMA